MQTARIIITVMWVYGAQLMQLAILFLIIVKADKGQLAFLVI